MKSFKYIIIIFLFSSQNLSAQGFGNAMLLDVLDPSQQNQNLMYNQNQFKEVLGSPFLFDTWTNGRLVGTSGKEFPNIDLKYDAYGDRIIIKKGGDLIVLDKKLVSGFTFSQNSEVFKFKTVNTWDETQKDRYVRVIYEKDVILYEMLSKVLIKGGTVNNGYNTTRKTKDKFVDKKLVFIKIKDNAPIEIKKNKKGFQTAFPDKKNEIKTFVKENKIDFNVNSDVSKLLAYLEGLMS